MNSEQVFVRVRKGICPEAVDRRKKQKRKERREGEGGRQRERTRQKGTRESSRGKAPAMQGERELQKGLQQ